MHRTVHTSCLCKRVYLKTYSVTLNILGFTCGIGVSQCDGWKALVESKLILVVSLIKIKSVNHYSSLISLLADRSNSLQHLLLTFKTQINLVASPEGELSVRATNLHDLHKMCVLIFIQNHNIRGTTNAYLNII